MFAPARSVGVLSFTLELVEKARVEGRGVKNFSSLDFWTSRLLDFSTLDT